jgi:hypothetical protein
MAPAGARGVDLYDAWRCSRRPARAIGCRRTRASASGRSRRCADYPAWRRQALAASAVGLEPRAARGVATSRAAARRHAPFLFLRFFTEPRDRRRAARRRWQPPGEIVRHGAAEIAPLAPTPSASSAPRQSVAEARSTDATSAPAAASAASAACRAAAYIHRLRARRPGATLSRARADRLNVSRAAARRTRRASPQERRPCARSS